MSVRHQQQAAFGSRGPDETDAQRLFTKVAQLTGDVWHIYSVNAGDHIIRGMLMTSRGGLRDVVLTWSPNQHLLRVLMPPRTFQRLTEAQVLQVAAFAPGRATRVRLDREEQAFGLEAAAFAIGSEAASMAVRLLMSDLRRAVEDDRIAQFLQH